MDERTPREPQIETFLNNPWPFMPSVGVRQELSSIPYDPNFLETYVASQQPKIRTDILKGHEGFAHEGDAVWRLVVSSWIDKLNISYNDQWFTQITEAYKAKRGIQLAIADSTIGRLFRDYRQAIDRPVSNVGLVEAFEASLGAYFLQQAKFRGLPPELLYRIHQQMAQLPRVWFVPLRGDYNDHLVTHFGSIIEVPREDDGRSIRNARQLIGVDGTIIYESRGNNANQAVFVLNSFIQESASELKNQLGIDPSLIFDRD